MTRLAAICILISAVFADVASAQSSASRLFIARSQLTSFSAADRDSTWLAAATAFVSKSEIDGQLSVVVQLALPQAIAADKIAWDARSSALQMQMAQQAVASFEAAVADLTPSASIKTFTGLPFVQVSANADLINRIFSLPNVVSIGEEGYGKAFLYQTIPQIGADIAFGQGATGSGQVVAIIDSGVDHTNPFFTGKVVAQACYSTPDPTLGSFCAHGLTSPSQAAGSGDNCTFNEGCFHGTHMAGVAVGTSTAGVGPGGVTLRGVAPTANLISIMDFSASSVASVCNGEHAGTPPCYIYRESDTVSALNFVYSLRNTFNIAAVNISYGLTLDPLDWSNSTCDSLWPLSVAAVNQLVAANIAVVAATGNNGTATGPPAYWGKIAPPACFSKVISVGAVGKPLDGGAFALYSNASAQMTLLAPGGNCYSPYGNDANCGIYSSLPAYLGLGNFGNTTPEGKLVGTSQAAAHVSGAIAAMRTLSPFASPAALATQLRNTGVAMSVTQAGYYSGTGYRIALNSAIVGPTAPSAPQNVSVTNQQCYGYNDVAWSAPASGTVTEYHLAGSASTTMANPTLQFNGTDTVWTVTIAPRHSLYEGVQACNLNSCSAWTVASTKATYFPSCK